MALITWSDPSDGGKRGFRIVHKLECDTSPDHSTLELSMALGTDGLSQLLSWLSYGPLADAEAPPAMDDIDGFVDLLRRIHVPHYEHARQYFFDEQIVSEWRTANQYAPYVDTSLQRIIRQGRDSV